MTWAVRVHKEFRGVSEGVLRIKALEQAVRSAEQAVISTQKSFQAGSRTRVDILNAENNKMTASRDLAQTRYLYLVSGLRLKALVEEADAQSMQMLSQVLNPNTLCCENMSLKIKDLHDFWAFLTEKL